MRILVRRKGALGDVIEVTAITARLRAENPDATIDVETAYPAVFQGNEHVNSAHPTGSYDRIIDLDGAFERAMRKLNPIDAYSQVAFGDQNTAHKLTFAWKPLNSMLTEVVGPNAVVLHPARSWPIRTLSLDWWQQLADLLNEREFRVIVTGTSQDHTLRGVTDLRGSLTLAGQAALIDQSRCFVCSESGPMILAQTTQTPIIALLTMIVPEHVIHDDTDFTVVRANVPCVGCALEQPEESAYFDCRFGHRNCLTSFDAKEVAGLVDKCRLTKAA